jgi:hypothetical protein
MRFSRRLNSLTQRFAEKVLAGVWLDGDEGV